MCGVKFHSVQVIRGVLLVSAINNTVLSLPNVNSIQPNVKKKHPNHNDTQNPTALDPNEPKPCADGHFAMKKASSHAKSHTRRKEGAALWRNFSKLHISQK